MNDAMICAEQLMAGYFFTWTNEFGETISEHKGYDSFAQACVENPWSTPGLQEALQLPEGNQGNLPRCDPQAPTRHEAEVYTSTGCLQGGPVLGSQGTPGCSPQPALPY
jgi:hypothetical protein